MHGRLAHAVPVLLQTQSVAPFGDLPSFFIRVATPVPEKHSAEPQLSDPPLVADIWATNMIARFLRAGKHLLHSGTGPSADADRSVSVLF